MSEIKTIIQKLAGTYGTDVGIILTCSVDSCSADDLLFRQCMVSPVNNNLASFPAQLMSEIDDGILIQPTVGSTVKVLLSGLNAPTVIQFSQIDKMLYIVGDTQLVMFQGNVALSQGSSETEEGVSLTLANQMASIKNDQYSFAPILQDILSQLNALIGQLNMATNIDTVVGGPNSAQFSAPILAQFVIIKENLLTDANKLSQLLF